LRDRGPSSAAPSEPSDLDGLREAIDSIDREILKQLNARAALVGRVAELKPRLGLAPYDAARERDLVRDLTAANPGPFPDAAIGPVFREIISGTRSLEGALRVAFLGPVGTFSHLAVRELFGAQVESVSVASFGEVLDALARDQAELGVLPLENTTEGVVTHTLDLLAQASVSICGELRLPVSHHLLSRSGRLEDVRRVASHPQPLAQCRGWLERHLPGVERVELASTAAAARLAAGDGSVAAVGPAIAAEVYGLARVAARIEDRSDNTTRFLVLGGAEPAPSGCDATLVVYTVSRAQPGALHALLDPFARHRVNLAAIHARPIPGKPWEYLFFLELEGHRADDPVAKAMAEAEALAHSSRWLGSFPRAAGGGPR
jgi:chorismate mutase/prephenate dehydratase